VETKSYESLVLSAAVRKLVQARPILKSARYRGQLRHHRLMSDNEENTVELQTKADNTD